MLKKIDAREYDSDKSINAHYLRIYERYFEPFVDKEIELLELGVKKGGSLQLWRDYFSKGIIAGLDKNPVEIEDTTGRIHFFQGEQQDISLLDRLARKVAPEGFDIIIDDCSHIGELARISFWHLFSNHLKPGGLYIIEDWGTGYWDSWPDGKNYSQQHAGEPDDPSGPTNLKKAIPSHNYGMVGFIKELIDEVGMDDITHPNGRGISPFCPSEIEEMHISLGLVIITKKKRE